ncbi:hypothetical protein [Mesobacterium pallidum]|uniref:hypothetical protein n=1 Tax=Mesobacterium pallidum TaxID=2872037 RepID=UPI001EE31514|nr:hypothetical protein [Mesobacterium pallidum]
MDPIAIVYYLAVCAALTVYSPRIKSTGLRMGIGAGVGMVAAGALPYLKTFAGF